MSEEKQKFRVCIIGAGVSGLPCVKTCLEEGLEPVCFEKTDDIGGLWNYRKHYQDISTVMKSTIVNTSKEMMCYSDFPPDADCPNFWHHSVLVHYLRDYADHFKLMKHIRLNTPVTSLRKASDYEKSGQWVVGFCVGGSGSGGEVGEEVFDAVMVASGHHMTRHVPYFQGMEQFQGRVLHSQQYRDFSGFEGKRILVVGIGNSALDIAVELSRVAKQVYLSTRRGTWIWNRVSKRGYPYDVWYFSRLLEFARFNIFGLRLVNKYFQHLVNVRMDHQLYSLKPQHGFFQQHPAVNDQLPNCICSGTIVIKGDILRFSAPKSVHFVDGSAETVDAVVLCTGYSFGFPFLEPQDLIPVRENRVDLYRRVFPPDFAHSTLAVIGMIQPIGSIQPISEMQGRWAAKVFKGDVKLPPQEKMWQEINRRTKETKERYFDSPKHTIQVDYVPYMEELAGLIGVNLPYFRLMVKDPKLLLACVLGPCTPYTYRLFGANCWPGARDAILTTNDRVLKPLQTRKMTGKVQSDKEKSIIYAARFLGIILGVVVFCGVWHGLLVPESSLVFFGWSLGFLVFLAGFLLVFDSYFDMSTIV